MPRLEAQPNRPRLHPDRPRGAAPCASRDFAGRRVILFFYPAAMTPGCTKEACDFRDSLVRLQQAGYDVVGISPDPPAKLARFVEQESLTYPLLSDPDKQVMDAYGAYGEKSLYGKKVTGVIRSTVVVGPGRDGRAGQVQRQGHRSRRLAQQGAGLAARPAPARPAVTPRPGLLRHGPGAATCRPVRSGLRGSGETGRHAGFRFLCLRA